MQNKSYFNKKLITYCYFITSLLLTTILTISPTANAEDLVNINPDPNGEPWMVGGLRELTEQEKQELESLTNPIEERRNRGFYSPTPLPSSVDNSQSKYFRPIFSQGKWGSCAQASGIGYVFTYEMARARNVNASSITNQYSGEFAWVFLNGGHANHGSHYRDGWKIAEDIGIPSIATVQNSANFIPFKGDYHDYAYYNYDPEWHKKWMDGYQNYYQAAFNKVDKSQGSNSPYGIKGIGDIKRWLAEGHIGSFSTKISDGVVVNATDYSAHAGELVQVKWGSEGRHAMTAVGYDDDVCYQYTVVEIDDSIFPPEVIEEEVEACGAFKVANSWGPGWNNKGFVWVAYHLFNQIDNDKIYTPKVKPYNEPLKMININLDHPHRSYIHYIISENTPNIVKGQAFAPNPWIIGDGGKLPMSGNDTPSNLEFAIDASDIINEDSTAAYLIVRYTKGGSEELDNANFLSLFMTDYEGITPVEYRAEECYRDKLHIGPLASADVLICPIPIMPKHTVSTDSTNGGKIVAGDFSEIRNDMSANGERTVIEGDITKFILEPDTGYRVSYADGCDGWLAGNTYITNPIDSDCTIYAAFDKIIYTVTAEAATGGEISPTEQKIQYGETGSFTVTPDTDYKILRVSGCNGILSGNTYTTGEMNADCNIYAEFVLKKNVVSAYVVNNTGGIVSPQKQEIEYGKTASINIVPDNGYAISYVEGCNGSLSGNTYTTGEINEDCKVNAGFGKKIYMIEAVAGAGGSIDPVLRNVLHGEQTSFTITPDSGYRIASIGGCDGSLNGNVYTTGTITEKCTVNVSFSNSTYLISTNAGQGGSISPTSKNAEYGETVSFTVTADTGYSISSVTGCNGSLSGNTYTTGQISQACTVSASFSKKIYTVIASAGQGGSVNPESISVQYGNSAEFTITPANGYEIDTAVGCNGTLSGNTYTVGPIYAACAVNVSFKKEEAVSCEDYTEDLEAHLANDRVWSEYTGTCWGTFCYGGQWNIYTKGSDILISHNGTEVHTLYEKSDKPGYWYPGECPEEIDPVPPVVDSVDTPVVTIIDQQGDVLTFRTTVTGTASDANNDLSEIHIGAGVGSILCSGASEFTCIYDLTYNKADLPVQGNFFIAAIDEKGNKSEAVATDTVTFEFEETPDCVQYTETLNEHLDDDRIWSEYTGSCWGSFCWGGQWNIYTKGTDILISHDGNETHTLHEFGSEPGYWYPDACPE